MSVAHTNTESRPESQGDISDKSSICTHNYVLQILSVGSVVDSLQKFPTYTLRDSRGSVTPLKEQMWDWHERIQV